MSTRWFDSLLPKTTIKNNDNEIPCEIKSPQFKDNKIDRWHYQKGIFFKNELRFYPFDDEYMGNHEVYFANINDFYKALVREL